MADIVYCYNHEVYFNLTNKCPCNCTFCIRNNGDSVGSAKTERTYNGRNLQGNRCV